MIKVRNMETSPQHVRRNMILLVGNYITFGMGLAFFSSNTVMPVFLRYLTSSNPLIGLITAIQSVGWLTTQLVAARWIHNKPRRKPYLIYFSLGAPLAYMVLALALFGIPAGRDALLLGVFVLCVMTAALVDGLIGVPWLDFLGKAVPASVRGRLMGIQELLFAICSVGVGAIVAHFLGPNAPPFPQNFAWLAVCAGVAFWVALVFFLPLYEPAEANPSSEAQPTWSEYIPLLREILRTDRHFVVWMAVRTLGGLFGLALPFFVLYATRELGLPASLTGAFLSAQVMGSAVGSLVLGYVYDRRGSRLIIRVVLVISAGVLIAALTAPLLRHAGILLQAFFVLLFFFLGISAASTAGFFIGHMNFIIDYAPPAQRPIYIGLSNTLAGPVSLVSILGGWILQVSSYSVLFGVTLVFILMALLLSAQLPEPKRALREETAPT